MTRNGIYENASQHSSTKGKTLRLTKIIDGRPTVVTILRHNQRTLVASLNDRETLVEAAAKKRLAALLIPLVSEYVGSQNADLKTGDGVRIVFGKFADNRRPGKRCVLFSEDAGVHAHPTRRRGKQLSSSVPEPAPLPSFRPLAVNPESSDTRTTSVP